MDEIFTKTKKEVTWDINKIAVVDTTEVRGKCTRRLAQNAIRNAKFLLNPVGTVQYIAKIAFQSARTKIVKSESNGEMKRRGIHGR